MGIDHAPILASSGPFFRNIHHGQIEHLEKAVVRRKDRFRFGHLTELTVETFDGVRGIDQPQYLFQVPTRGA